MSHLSLRPESTNYLQEHVALLRRRFPAAAQLLEQHSDRILDSVQVTSARNGMLTASVRRPSGLIHVHSIYNPVVEALRWADGVNSQESGEFLVVIGMGLGYHLEPLLADRPHRQLVVIEPDPDLFLAAMTVRDHRNLLQNPRLDLFVTNNGATAASWLVHRYRRQLLKEPAIVVWPATSRYAPEFWSTFQRQLLDVLRATRTNLATNRAFSTKWIENFFANLRFCLTDPGINSLLTLFRGRPGIIASAGPSLERNIHLLSSAKGRAVIIAAGSTINPLLKHGVEPDILVSFDPGEGNYRHFENLNTPNLPLIYIPTIYPRIIEEYAGPRFATATDVSPFVGWFFKEIGQDKGWLSSGPSVANVAWDLALKMGLNPIILVGQDLAYTGHKSHAEGATHARSVQIDPQEVGTKYLEVEAVDGGTVFTNRPMYSMKVWFEQRIRKAPPEHVTIDATEGGAKIDGAQIMPLQVALERYCREPFNPHKTLLELHQHESARLSARLSTTAFEQRLQTVLDQLRNHLEATEEIAELGLQAGKQLLLECKTKRLTGQRYREALNRLERLMKELSRLVAFQVFIAPVIPHILDSITLSIQSRWEEQITLHDKGRELARQHLVLFGTVKRVTRLVTYLVRRQ